MDNRPMRVVESGPPRWVGRRGRRVFLFSTLPSSLPPREVVPDLTAVHEANLMKGGAPPVPARQAAAPIPLAADDKIDPTVAVELAPWYILGQ